MKKITLYFFLLSFVLPLAIKPLAADPLYVQLAEESKPNDEQQKKAEKQITERTEISLQENLFVSPFHKRDKQGQAQKPPVCHHCHLALPHRKNIQKRSFLNMHTRYIACETCHFKPKGYSLTYQWQDISLVKTEIAKTKNEQVQKSLVENNPGKRVMPYYEGSPVGIFSDHPYAEKIKNQWKIKTNTGKAYLKARLHSFLEEKGPDCADCHTKDTPLLDLEKLGANQRQINQFLTNPIPNFFSRFKSDEERLRITDLLR